MHKTRFSSLLHTLLIVTAMMLFAASTKADTVNFAGSTTAGATFNRPLTGIPPTGLSGVGTAVRYLVTQLTVSQNGSYVFNSTSTYDNFTILYANSFNPLSPLTNALAANDDNPTIGISGFTINLTTGVTYLFVNTGFANSDFGAFTSTITGPGIITIVGAPPGAIPEPATMLLFGTGLAGLVAFARRRRQAND